jgi:hypothetical protein
MRLSIVPVDETVCENGVCFIGLSWVGTPEDIHALQWDDEKPVVIDDVEYYGWLEFTDGKHNQWIAELPQWAINAQEAWYSAANPPPPPPPTPEEIQAQNKAQAESLLQATDWTATVDIANPQYSNPYLANQDAFLSYRSEVRQIAVNPPTTPVESWPTLPSEEWVYV